MMFYFGDDDQTAFQGAGIVVVLYTGEPAADTSGTRRQRQIKALRRSRGRRK